MKLKNWLARQQETRESFSDRVGITRQALWLILERRCQPSLETAFAIENATGRAVKAASWLHPKA